MTTPPDELQRLYEEASALEDEQPAPRVRSAVLAHAAMLAQGGDRATGVPLQGSTPSAPEAANWPKWKWGLVASVLLVPVAGYLVLQLTASPQEQIQVAALPATEVPPVPAAAPVVAAAAAVPAQAKAEAAPARRRDTGTVDSASAKVVAPVVPAPADATVAPVGIADVVVASAAPGADRRATSSAPGAVAAAQGRAERSEAAPGVSLARSQESVQMASNLAAPPAAPSARPMATAKLLATPADASPQKAALLAAARQGNVQLVQNFLNEGASIESSDAQGRTLLMLAVLGGHESLVKRLLEKGASRSAVDHEGLTALELARRLGFAALVSLLE